MTLFDGMSVLDPDAIPWPFVVLVSLCSGWHFTYLFAFIGEMIEQLRGDRGRLTTARRLLWWAEVHLAFPAMLIYWALTIDGLVDAICLVVNSWVWWDWYQRHDGDDQWKKRRKKALAKIKQVAGKLVVVPVPSPSPA